MSEHSLEARLQMVARALDADAPAFDPAVLRAARRHPRRTVIMLAVAALAVATAAPAAISALRDLFDVELVPELTEAPNAVGPYLGPPVPFEVAKTSVAFRVRTIPALGTPDGYHMRPDIKGGMVTRRLRRLSGSCSRNGRRPTSGRGSPSSRQGGLRTRSRSAV